jgi:cell division protein FtsB
LSQVANTFWDDRVERVGAAVKVSPVVKRRVRARRLVDAIILTIILAAAATCVSVYSRARTELDSALVRHEAAGVKVEDLTIRVQKLERDVKQLRTDSRVIELFARQRFGFVRSGDVVIKVSQDQSDATSAATSKAMSPAAVVTGPVAVTAPRAAVDTPRTGQGVAMSTAKSSDPDVSGAYR